MQEDLKAIKERARSIGLPHRVWSRLASTPDSKIYEQNLSNWLCGDKLSDDKIKRLIKALEDVEDLCSADPLKLDLSDANNVRLALARLAEKRAESHAANILAEDSKARWAGAVAIAPANPEILTEPLANKV